MAKSAEVLRLGATRTLKTSRVFLHPLPQSTVNYLCCWRCMLRACVAVYKLFERVPSPPDLPRSASTMCPAMPGKISEIGRHACHDSATGYTHVMRDGRGLALSPSQTPTYSARFRDLCPGGHVRVSFVSPLLLFMHSTKCMGARGS